MSVQNYEVNVHLFGEWPRGTVLPRFAVAWAGGVDELVEREIVRPTKAPVPKAVTDRLAELAGARARASAPAPPAVPDAVSAELEQLRAAAAAADDATAAQAARADAAEERCRALTAELAGYVETNAHLTRACDEHQAAAERLEREAAALRAQAAQLTADLEAATAPAPKTAA